MSIAYIKLIMARSTKFVEVKLYNYRIKTDATVSDFKKSY